MRTRRRLAVGTVLLGIGAAHTALGVWELRGPLGAMAREGLVATVPGALLEPAGLPRAVALWFLLLGGALLVLGALCRWVERDLDRALPAWLGWALAALALAAAAPMPVTGAWSLLVPAWLVLARAARAAACAEVLAARPELAPLLANADHVDVKSVVAATGGDAASFAAAMFARLPRWVAGLMGVRAAVARVLGLAHPRPARPPRAEELTPGAAVGPFRVVRADAGRTLALAADDGHLRAHLVVLADGGRFRVVTVVHYNDWRGPLYFNLIRPFHHLVVESMARAGARAAPAA